MLGQERPRQSPHRLDYQESDLFLRGLRHLQPEPTWGGPSDTAGPLRSACALALVQCRDLSSQRALTALLPLFADKEVPVRVNAIRAVEQIGTDSAALLIRLRAELALPSDSPEILGACLSAILSLEGTSAIPWAARFLTRQDDAAAEAAIAIAQTHTPEAFMALHKAAKTAQDPWFRPTLLQAIALTRQQPATDWLVQQIKEETEDAADAHAALCQAAPSEATRTRLQNLNRPCK